MGGKVTLLVVAAGLIAGCGGTKPAAQADGAEKPGVEARAAHEDKDDTDKDNSHSVKLTPDERTRLGIISAPAQAINFTQSTTAFAVVLSHETIAQVVSDLETAASAAHLSQTALTRGQNLATGPGALGVDALETLQKQAAADRSALSLAQRKLTVVLGMHFPWPGGARSSNVLDALASGRSKLVRATFPSGAFEGASPKSLRLIPLDPGTAAGLSPTASPVWDAPQDTTLPGRSFFALIEKTDVPEGLRLQAMPIGASNNGVAGVLIPAAAVVISNSQYWCYLEKAPGTFTRVSIDIGRPLGQGYFVNDGVAEGDPVVTSAAGLLLARETNSGSESAD